MYMDFKFSKDSENSQQENAPGEKKNQSALLVLLLILVGGFSYLYFFTDLIKPQEAQKTTEAAAPAPQAVKMPLPKPEGDAAVPDEKTPKALEAPKAAAGAPAAAAPAAKTAAVPPKAAPVAKPAPALPKPKEEPKKVEAVKPADKKPQPAAVVVKKDAKAVTAKAEDKKPATDVKKPAVAVKKSAPEKEVAKKSGSEIQTKPVAVVKAKNVTATSWTIIAGSYVLEETLSADMGRIRKAGFEPKVKTAARKKTTMNRLFLSDFNDRVTAQSTLEKLKRHTSDAFIMEQGGKFALYAGSYSQSDSAKSEKERLKTAGFTTTVKTSDIEIPAQTLSVGPFNNKKDADAALAKLKSAGIKATISQK